MGFVLCSIESGTDILDTWSDVKELWFVSKTEIVGASPLLVVARASSNSRVEQLCSLSVRTSAVPPVDVVCSTNTTSSSTCRTCRYIVLQNN